MPDPIPCECCKRCRFIYIGTSKIPGNDSLTATLIVPKFRHLFDGKPYLRSFSEYPGDEFDQHIVDWPSLAANYGITAPAIDCVYELSRDGGGTVIVVQNTCDLDFSKTDEFEQYAGWHCGTTLNPDCGTHFDTEEIPITLNRIPVASGLPGPLPEGLDPDDYARSCCEYYGEVTHEFSIPWKSRRVTFTKWTNPDPPYDVLDVPSGFSEASGTTTMTVRFRMRLIPCSAMTHKGRVYAVSGQDLGGEVLGDYSERSASAQVIITSNDDITDLAGLYPAKGWLHVEMVTPPPSWDTLHAPSSLLSDSDPDLLVVDGVNVRTHHEGLAYCAPVLPGHIAYDLDPPEGLTAVVTANDGFGADPEANTMSLDWHYVNTLGDPAPIYPYNVIGQMVGFPYPIHPISVALCAGEPTLDFFRIEVRTPAMMAGPPVMALSGPDSGTQSDNRPPCQHLGSVVSFCTSADARRQALRNVHRCEHPEHGDAMGRNGLVTRGKDCQACPHYQPAEEAPGSPGP